MSRFNALWGVHAVTVKDFGEEKCRREWCPGFVPTPGAEEESRGRWRMQLFKLARRKQVDPEEGYCSKRILNLKLSRRNISYLKPKTTRPYRTKATRCWWCIRIVWFPTCGRWMNCRYRSWLLEMRYDHKVQRKAASWRLLRILSRQWGPAWMAAVVTEKNVNY